MIFAVPGPAASSWVAAVQNQSLMGDCWTFASATAIDSNLLKNGYFGGFRNAAADSGLVVAHFHSRRGTRVAGLQSESRGLGERHRSGQLGWIQLDDHGLPHAWAWRLAGARRE